MKKEPMAADPEGPKSTARTPRGRPGEARLRAVFDTAIDGMVVIDASGTVQLFSAACERIFGYAAPEVVGNNVKMLMPSPYHEQHDGYLAAYLRTGKAKIIGIGREVVGRRKDGSNFPMNLAVGEGRDADGRFFVAAIRDLSTRRELERKLDLAQREVIHMSRVSDMAVLASTLAHELNQPLAAIGNYMAAARRLLATGATENASGLLQKAGGEVTRAGQIIRRLRDFLSGSQAGRTAERVAVLVEEAISLALVGPAAADIQVRIELAPDLPPLEVDRIQIQQVLYNLLRNAVEAVEGCARREIAVSARRIENMIEIAVADSGPGLAPNIAERLFQPFVTSKAKGMGIGLSICRNIVEAHGGSIAADGDWRGGARFLLTLPAAGGTA
jgi:two-component system, LuxR family, sensor kinase FixL